MTSTTSYVIYDRDEFGAPFAIEIVEARRWSRALLDPPPPERADTRIVTLLENAPPAGLPRWLHVETPALRVAEVAARYEARNGQRAPARRRRDRSALARGRALWPWSPHHRPPAASLDGFLAAGAAALRHPAPVPAGREERLALISELVAGRPAPFAPLATLQADALERWLAYAFRDPDAFADALLLERIESSGDGDAGETVAALRFLREAEVAGGSSEYAELLIDRRALLEQASPWRYVEGAPFAGALAAVQAWVGRYRQAYRSHYRAVVARADEVRSALRAAEPAATALGRLDDVSALGPPAGEQALDQYRAAAALDAFPQEPDLDAARTASVTLGREPALFGEAVAAASAVRRALDVQRRRLASSTVRMVLARPGVAALDRLLQAIGASDVEAIEHVLDDALAAHIEALLAAAAESPLAQLAARHPEVTAETLNDVTETFRALLRAAVAASEEQRVSLH